MLLRTLSMLNSFGLQTLMALASTVQASSPQAVSGQYPNALKVRHLNIERLIM